MTREKDNNDVVQIRPPGDQDQPWIARLLEEHWGGVQIVTRGRIHIANRLPGFIAELDDHPVGFVTYLIENDQCEVTSLNSECQNRGVATQLLAHVCATARAAGVRRMWLITTNDNLHALRFYQKRGWTLVAVHAGAIEKSRLLKPGIPPTGDDGIPIRDEIELEYLLR